MYLSIEETKTMLNGLGYKIQDPWDIVDIFEKMLAEYSGSKYAVAVDNCTNALFLCLKYLKASGEIRIPAKTYVSVPQTIIHAGCTPIFEDIAWEGMYTLNPLPIIDGATRFKKDMYTPNTYHCLSFHLKKNLNIGKGGMILTDDFKAYEWFKKARYEGRDISVKYDDDNISDLGWNMYMPPEQAGYGIQIFLKIKSNINPDCGGSWKYPDVRNFNLFKGSS